MREIAFNVVAFLGGAIIYILQNVGRILASVVGFVFVFLIRTSGNISGALLQMIDKERLMMYSAFNQALEPAEDEGEEAPLSELQRQDLELKLLSAVSDVKAHAEENEDGWTDDHTEALSSVATSLVQHLGCDEDEVLEYMRRTVESIPGLELGLEDNLD